MGTFFHFRAMLILAVALLTVQNFSYQSSHLAQSLADSFPDENRYSPGYHVEAARPYLAGAHVIGYFIVPYEYKLRFDSAMVYRFQRSQYALAPTVLDWDRVFDHDLVLFDCKVRNCFAAPIQEHQLTVVRQFSDHLLLARKKKD